MGLPPLRRLLDPRREGDAYFKPIQDAVNIPFKLFQKRLHELPPKSETIVIPAGVEYAEDAVDWLQNGGRHAETTDDFEWGSPPRKPGRLWKPNPYLQKLLPRLQHGKALDLGCGSGRDIAFLASEGFEVTGIDIHREALDNAKRLAHRCAPDVNVRLIQDDLNRESHLLDSPQRSQEYHLAQSHWLEESYDLILFLRYMNRRLVSECRHMLKPGGSIVIEAFTEVHRETHGRPKSGAVSVAELLSLLEGLEIAGCSEAWHSEVHTAQVWARRLS